MTVGLVLALACNRGCCSMFENVLLNSHFFDKGSIVWQSYFFFFALLCGIWHVRNIIIFCGFEWFGEDFGM